MCSLIRYVRSWSSDRDDPEELGAEQLDSWSEGIRRAMDFRKRTGDERFSDVAFADLQADPVNTLAASYEAARLTFTDATAALGRAVGPRATDPGARGAHDYDLADYGLTPEVCPRTVRGVPRAPMTRAHDPTTLRDRRDKLAPDPDVRRTIVAAASKSVREQGVRGLSVSVVLDRARPEHPGVLSTFRFKGPAGCGRLPGNGSC